MKIRNILITGAAGFVGSHLAERLLGEGYRVTGIDNLATGVQKQVPKSVRFFKRDIRDPSIVSLFGNIQAVFHLAAKNCISDCQNDPVETTDINVRGTANVLEACRKANVSRVIVAESSALYEGCTQYPTSEEEVCPQSFYAQSKLAAHALATAYQRYYRLPCTSLRYFNVYGPRQDYRRTIPPAMSAFIIQLLKRQRPVIYGTGQKKRDFIYVDDINDFHLLCLKDRRSIGQTYNLGSGKKYSILQVYRMIDQMLQTGIKPIFKRDLPGEAQVTLADIGKARKLGWKPKTTLEDGLQNSIEYIRRVVVSHQ